jgi:serine phosphatase RsbU (regulator of sigma subunit)
LNTIGEIFVFLLTLFEYVSFLLIVFYFLYQTRIIDTLRKNKLDWLLVIVLIVLLGGLSILATIQGVRMTDAQGNVRAIANTRDMAPFIAGVLGGPLAGLGTGLIGGLHRYFYGGATRLPCGVATILAGALGGLVYFRKKEEFLKPGTGFLVIALYESFHMFLVWLLSDYFTSFTSVVTLAVPMILSNSIGIALFALMIAIFKRQRELIAAKEKVDHEVEVVHSLQLTILPKVETELSEDKRGNRWYEWLIPHMAKEVHKKGEVLFSKEDRADKLFYIASGLLYLKEIDKHVGQGEIIGETGILSPFHQRTITAICETDMEAYTLTREKVIDLSYQKPQLLSDLIQLSIKRVLENLKMTISEKERMESELQIAYRIQTDMLPHDFPRQNDFAIYAAMYPAKMVGGDLYDFFPVGEEKYCFLIGDVSGKGIPAALFMVITKTLLKQEALRGIKPDEILSRVNSILCAENEEGMFVTVFLGILDRKTGIVEFANAGHNPPLLLPANGGPESLAVKSGFVLGGMPAILFETQSISLNPGDILYLYTDGITEAMNDREELFSDGRLLEILNGLEGRDVTEIENKVQTAVREYVRDAPQSDDITMVVVKYNG